MEINKMAVKKKLRTIVILLVLIILAILIYTVVKNTGKRDSMEISSIEKPIQEPTAPVSSKTPEAKTLDGHTLVAENDLYELYLYEPALSIMVRDKQTGAVMESTVRKEENLTNVNETWKGFLQSGVVVEVQEDTNTIQRKVGLENSGAAVQVTSIAGGFQAKIDYTDLEFGFTLEVKLYDDGSITAYVPESSIYENADNKKIGNIYLFPLLGNTRLGEVAGYMLIPDGNGALIYLDDKEGRFDSGYVQKVYGSDIGVGESYVLSLLWDQYETHNDAEQILAPVYGMVHTENQLGYLAVIESGEEEASIYGTPNGAYSDYNWVTASFRKCAAYIQPTSKSGGSVTKVTDRIGYDIKIRYLFVHGEEANYTGLAKRYRTYLTEKQELTEGSDEYKVRVDFLGSDVENWMMWKKDVTVTTVEQIRTIYEDLQSQGVEKVLSIYKGWQKGGVNQLPVTSLSVGNSIGGKGELLRLLADTEQTQMELYLYTDGIRANPKTANTTFDTVKKMDKRLYQEQNDKTVYETFVYWTPQKTKENLEKLAENLSANQVSRLAVSNIGNTLFTYTMSDVMQTRSVGKYMYEQTLQGLDETMEVILEEPVACYWKYSHAMVDMPVSDSDYIYTDQSVPFLSIALKGFVPMYGDYVNFEANERAYFLKLVETGMNPSFYITFEDPSALIYTNSSDVYTSKYEVYREQIVTYYQELEKVHQAVENSAIVGHKIFDNGVTEVIYDNGVTIYINYGKEAVQVQDETIPALSYIICDHTLAIEEGSDENK